jgi:hypothetical protein
MAIRQRPSRRGQAKGYRLSRSCVQTFEYAGNLSLEAENWALAGRVLHMAAEALRSSDVQ